MAACWVFFAALLATSRHHGNECLPPWGSLMPVDPLVHFALCNVYTTMLDQTDCSALCIYATCLALHCLLWNSHVENTKNNIVHKYIQQAVSYDFAGYRLSFFNTKQVFLLGLLLIPCLIHNTTTTADGSICCIRRSVAPFQERPAALEIEKYFHSEAPCTEERGSVVYHTQYHGWPSSSPGRGATVSLRAPLLLVQK